MNQSVLWDPLRPASDAQERTGPTAWIALLDNLANAIRNEPLPFTRISRIDDVRDLIAIMSRETTKPTEGVKHTEHTNGTSFAEIWDNKEVELKSHSSPVRSTASLTHHSVAIASPQIALEGLSKPTLGTRQSSALLVFDQSLRSALSEGSRVFVADYKAFVAARTAAFGVLLKRGIMTKPAHEQNLNTLMIIWATLIFSRDRAERIARLTGSGAPKPYKTVPPDDDAVKRRAFCATESDNLAKVFDAYRQQAHLMHHPILRNMHLSNFYRYFWMLSEEIERSDSPIHGIIAKHGITPSKNQGPTGAAFSWILYRLEGLKPGKSWPIMEKKFYQLIQVGRFLHSMQRTLGKGSLALITPKSLEKYLPLDSRTFLHVAEAIKSHVPQSIEICQKLGERLVDPVIEQQYVVARETAPLDELTFLEYIDQLLPDGDDGSEYYRPAEPFQYQDEEFPPLA
ncbi:hypothetical protein CAC42_8176 [Sphaceloma murrayae]|uniref:Uncharacterized protein n=1 Tax=Sphaceloma murrayae TaxID=2082308 RepID=A0A2K1QJ42_9PEZI|nr:hypothetical protein CAC42_8176 [Sphaceloma murrayae]